MDSERDTINVLRISWSCCDQVTYSWFGIRIGQFDPMIGLEIVEEGAILDPSILSNKFWALRWVTTWYFQRR